MELHADFDHPLVCRKIGCRHGRFMFILVYNIYCRDVAPIRLYLIDAQHAAPLFL
jgi:hypothetical protein